MAMLFSASYDFYVQLEIILLCNQFFRNFKNYTKVTTFVTASISPYLPCRSQTSLPICPISIQTTTLDSISVASINRRWYVFEVDAGGAMDEQLR